MKEQLTRLAALTAFAALTGVDLAQAAEPGVHITIGAATKSMTEVAIAPGQTSLALIIEGAGRITTAAGTLRVHGLCTITDTLHERKVVNGRGDCEFRSTRGEVGYARFETDPGLGDRGRMVFSGGQGRFAGLGSIPVEVSVNPYKVGGKSVFLIEDIDSAGSDN